HLSFRSSLAAAALLVFAGAIVAPCVPARADPPRRDDRRDDRHDHRPPPRHYYRPEPGPVYAPPVVGYAAPAPSPGINLIVPLNIR
ncbi:MAG TPA: hypothetical protein VE397_21160, partial [Stellaceae bacterium]|nr:hypothetical protein [Stellaceae bacterium]